MKNEEMEQATNLMYDMARLALQTDGTRVVTVCLGQIYVRPNMEGITDQIHGLTHHGGDESKIAQLKMIETMLFRSLDRRAFLDGLDTRLLAADIATRAGDGRAAIRRLSRTEYEHALQDLLAMPWLRVKEMLPSDGSRGGFDKVGEGLAISPVQIRQYLAAANRALDLATAGAEPPPPQKLVIRAQDAFAHQLREKEAFLVECFQPAETSGSASGIAFVSGGNNIAKRIFFTAPHAGQYRFRLATWGFWCDRGVIQPNDRTEVAALWSGNQPLGFFDAPSFLPQTHEITVWLDKGAQVTIDAETIREWNHHTIVTYVGPGVAFDSLEVEGPLVEAWPPESHRRLYGDLPEEPVDPEQEARRLLAAFLPQAFRRPVPDAEVESLVVIVRDGLAAHAPFRPALRQAYATALCSAAFLFRAEQTGPLDDAAVATRLALWLWNSTPDDQLLSFAAASRLREAGALDAQVERLLADRKSDRFVADFLDQWLKLSTIDDTTPDRRVIARNLLEKLLVYVTGAEIHHADRREIERLLDETSGCDFGVRSLVKAIARSPLFLSK